MNTPDTFRLELSMTTWLFAKVVQQPPVLLDLLGEDQRRALQDFIFDHLQDKDGGPEIADLLIHTIQYDEQRATGSFRLHFTINRRFCCSDIENCRTDYIDFIFSYRHETFTADASYFEWQLDN